MNPRTYYCHVSGTLASLLRFSRFVGLAPLSFVRTQNGWRVTRSRAFKYYGNIVMTLIIIGCVTTVMMDMGREPGQAVHLKWTGKGWVWLFNAMVILVTVSISCYGSWNQMGTMISCFSLTQKMFNRLKMDHTPWPSERVKMCIVVSWLIMTIFIVGIQHLLKTTLSATMMTMWINLMYTCHYFAYCILQIQVLQFLLIALYVMNTFMFINEHLRRLPQVSSIWDINMQHQMIVACNKKVGTNGNKRRRWSSTVKETIARKYMLEKLRKQSEQRHHHTVHNLALVYTTACTVVRDMDKCYGVILLLLLSLSLIQLVMSPYYCILLLTRRSHNTRPMQLIFAVLQFFWFIHHCCKLSMVIEPCHMTHTQMEITRQLVSHLICATHSKYEPLALELEVFYRHLLLSEASYSPAKLVTLTRSLLVPIFSNVITILVILLQINVG